MVRPADQPDMVDGRNSSDAKAAKATIRELIENWVLWRDAGDWDRFATVWHDDGRMIATWFNASASEFIEGCRKGFDAGVIGLHSLGGTSIDLMQRRAIAQTKMQIVQRGVVDAVEVDVTCLGRFVDAFEERDGQWGLVTRQLIYELDRMTPVDPAARLDLDKELLASFPIGYRHLAYLQTKVGFTVNKALPGTRGPEVQALAARMQRWLDGENAACLEV